MSAAETCILTLASTNDAVTLDEAAIRTGRFDAIVGLGYPTRTDTARILIALISGLRGPCGTGPNQRQRPARNGPSGSSVRR
jgi:SpoVK/Ycf46/Vps4 family AAA+-type ATPase